MYLESIHSLKPMPLEDNKYITYSRLENQAVFSAMVNENGSGNHPTKFKFIMVDEKDEDAGYLIQNTSQDSTKDHYFATNHDTMAVGFKIAPNHAMIFKILPGGGNEPISSYYLAGYQGNNFEGFLTCNNNNAIVLTEDVARAKKYVID